MEEEGGRERGMKVQDRGSKRKRWRKWEGGREYRRGEGGEVREKEKRERDVRREGGKEGGREEGTREQEGGTARNQERQQG